VTTTEGIEGVAADFSMGKMLEVRTRTRDAVNVIASRIEVGMTEREARSTARATLTELGLRRGWHPILVRVGENTTREFFDPQGGDVVLTAEDVFFVDIGPVCDGYEGDAGDTFVTGENPDYLKAKADVVEIWNDVRNTWFEQKLGGAALYEYATRISADRGWKLSTGLTGHRLSEFPHKAYFGGTISDIAEVPSPDLWVLEIALLHESRPFGAFYEDLLLEDQSFLPPLKAS
jgi:methionyl aminopeptidase